MKEAPAEDSSRDEVREVPHEKCTIVQKNMRFSGRKPMVFSALIPSFWRLFRGLGEASEGRIYNFRIRNTLTGGDKVFPIRKVAKSTFTCFTIAPELGIKNAFNYLIDRYFCVTSDTHR